MFGTGLRRAAVLAALAAALAAAPAMAQDDGTATCLNDGAAAQARVDACARMLEASGWTGEQRAYIHTRRGDAYVELYDYDRAVAEYDRAIRFDRNHANAWVGRGNIAFDWAKYDEAVQAYSEALLIEPDHVMALTSRGVAYAHLGQMSKGLADLDRAVRLDPGDPRPWTFRAENHRVRGDFPKALADINEALRLDPRLTVALLTRADIHFSMGNHQLALADNDEAVRLDPGVYSYSSRCLNRALAGQLATARADCEAALKLRPNDPGTLEWLGVVHLLAGNYREALATFEAQLAAAPHMSTGLYGRGLAREKLGQAEAGRADMAEATRRDPGAPMVYRNYGFPTSSKN